MYVIDRACSCVSFTLCGGVAEQKYNPKQALRLRHSGANTSLPLASSLRHCEEDFKSDVAISSPTLRHCEVRSDAAISMLVK